VHSNVRLEKQLLMCLNRTCLKVAPQIHDSLQNAKENLLGLTTIGGNIIRHLGRCRHFISRGIEIGFVFAYNSNVAFTYRDYCKEIHCNKRNCSPSSTLSGCSKTTSIYCIEKAHNSIKPGSEIRLTKRFFLTPRQTQRATVT
jgi:hypothetical protein